MKTKYGGTRAFVQALRRGRTIDEAFEEFCDADFVLPTTRDEWKRSGGDPRKCPADFFAVSSALAHAHDAVVARSSDERLAAEFERGLKTDMKRGLVFRVMLDDERPTLGERVRRMSLDEQMTLAKWFGVKFVAEAVVGSFEKSAWSQSG